MATTNVGNLHVKLMMTDRQFQAASNRVRTTNRVTEQSMNRLARGGMKNASRGLLELSRGAEDFASQFGTRGFAGGLTAAGNNLSQFAAMMNPVAGALAGLAVAGTTAWLSFNQGAEKASAKSKEIAERIKNNIAQIDVPLGALKDRFDNLMAGLDGDSSAMASLNRVQEIRKIMATAAKRDSDRLSAAIRARDAARKQYMTDKAASDRLGGSGDPTLAAGSAFSRIHTDANASKKRLHEAQTRLDDLNKIVNATIKHRKKLAEETAKLQKELQRQVGPARDSFLAGIADALKDDPNHPQANAARRLFDTSAERASKLLKGNQLDSAVKNIKTLSYRNIDRAIENLQNQRSRSRRLTALPSGADFFSAEAQNRLSRIATGRFQGEDSNQKMLKKLDDQIRELKKLREDIKNTKVKPVNL